TNRKAAEQKRLDGFTAYQSLVTKLRDATRALRDATAFAAFKPATVTSTLTGRTLASATAGGSAVPGTYGIEVIDVARATKVSGSVFASSSTALGLAGDIVVNGKTVSLTATDTLAQVRDRINAVNSGTTPSGVIATVLSTGPQEHRLVLTAANPGSSGVELIDNNGILGALGVTDGNLEMNLAANGAVQSNRISSATAALAQLLGITMPPPSTVTIGGKTISVDLTVDSITAIAARIAAAGASATVIEETVGGDTAYRLVTSDTVSASTPDGQRTLEILGMFTGARPGIQQVLTSELQLTAGAGGSAATAATTLVGLGASGSALGIAAGDTVVIQGMRGDGTVVSTTLAVTGTNTVQELLDQINSATSGFGVGTRTATATIVNGEFQLTDNTAGDSMLALSLSVQTSGGGTIPLGRQLVSTVGRLREVVTGTDSRVKVDGVTISRSSNTITDAITGVSLNLQQAEVGTTSTLTIDRDADAIAAAVKAVAEAYNAINTFRNEQTKPGAALHNNSTLRNSFASLTATVLNDVAGLTGTFKRAGATGLSLQRDGTLALDEAVFKASVAANYDDVVRVFSTSGSSTNPSLVYFSSGEKSVAGTYAVSITTAATKANVTGAGFSGTYTDDATSDTLTITSGSTSGNISLSNGDTTDIIVAKLNAMFLADGLALSASNSSGQVAIESAGYGAASTFTVAYIGGGADGTAQLGIGAATYSGTDIAGTIGGLAATGSGSVLTGVAGGVTENLSVQYTGAPIGAVGSVTFSKGVGGLLYEAADLIARTGGTITTQQDSLNRTIATLTTRADSVQQMLDRRREMLLKQFIAMESALQRLQQQTSALTSLLVSSNSDSN
ncbi:MAG: flagellar filament capping protein FliD, partial [Gemmatimonadota bacterium]